MFSTGFKGVGLHYTAFANAIREDSRPNTPSRGVSPRKKFAVEANVESRVRHLWNRERNEVRKPLHTRFSPLADTPQTPSTDPYSPSKPPHRVNVPFFFRQEYTYQSYIKLVIPIYALLPQVCFVDVLHNQQTL